MGFCAGTHLFLKALEKAGVSFPTTKAEVMEKLGDTVVQVGEDEFAPAAGIVEKFATDEYPNGSAFWCAYTASCYMEAKESMESVKKFRAQM